MSATAPLDGCGLSAVMIFAPDTHAAAQWWAGALGVEELEVEPHPQGDFVSFRVGAVEVGFHQEDRVKNPAGGSPVVYLAVPSLTAAREQLLARGATTHRGPLAVAAGRSVCQLRDPFGNVFGLDGPP